MSKHLRYDLVAADWKLNELRHPQPVMRELGITYSHSTPQSMADQWWFWNCENLPESLPGYLTKLALDPREQVGWGLSQQEADEIYRISQEHSQ